MRPGEISSRITQLASERSTLRAEIRERESRLEKIELVVEALARQWEAEKNETIF